MPVIEQSSAVVGSIFERARSGVTTGLKAIATNRFALIWILALVPFVMVTPAAVIAYCVLMVFRRHAEASVGEVLHYLVIAGVALINLKLSYDFSQEALHWLTNWFRELRFWLFDLRPKTNPSIRSAFAGIDSSITS